VVISKFSSEQGSESGSTESLVPFRMKSENILFKNQSPERSGVVQDFYNFPPKKLCKTNFFRKFFQQKKGKKKFQQKNSQKFLFQQLCPQKRFFMSLHSSLSLNEEKISHKIRQSLEKTKKIIPLSKKFFRGFRNLSGQMVRIFRV